MPDKQEHSAEWLRGAVVALGDATGARVDDCWEPKMSHHQQVARWDHYRALLAVAEAREATRKNGINPYWSGRADDSPRSYAEATQPTAAEVIAAFVAAWRHVLCGCRYATPDIAKGEGQKLLYKCQPCSALALAEKWRVNQLG